jgi:hypothetical protein
MFLQRVEAGADERRRRHDLVGQDDRLLRHLSKAPSPSLSFIAHKAHYVMQKKLESASQWIREGWGGVRSRRK